MWPRSFWTNRIWTAQGRLWFVASASVPLLSAHASLQLTDACNGPRTLQVFGIDPDDRALYFWVTVGFFFWFRLISYLGLKYINHIKR